MRERASAHQLAKTQVTKVDERINGTVSLFAPVKKENNKMYLSGVKKTHQSLTLWHQLHRMTFMVLIEKLQWLMAWFLCRNSQREQYNSNCEGSQSQFQCKTHVTDKKLSARWLL